MGICGQRLHHVGAQHMSKEIEQKYLLAPNVHGWKRLIARSIDIKQGYLFGHPYCTIRIRIEDDTHAVFCIKGKTTGISNPEYEWRVPLIVGRFLYWCCGRRIVTKVRHHVPHGAFLFEVDEFKGTLRGLTMAEVELKSENDRIDLPVWIGKEVSRDARYKNVMLMRHGIPAK